MRNCEKNYVSFLLEKQIARQMYICFEMLLRFNALSRYRATSRIHLHNNYN